MPYFGHGATPKNWALSEVSVNQKKVKGVPPADAATELAISGAKEYWPKWDRDMPIIVLTKSGSVWTGIVTKDGIRPINVRYDKASGFRLA